MPLYNVIRILLRIIIQRYLTTQGGKHEEAERERIAEATNGQAEA